MIEQTLFTDLEIKDIINYYYDIKVKSIKKIDKGSGNLFIICGEKQDFILKEFQSSYNKQDIEREYNLIKCLNADNTYEYILTKDKECCFLHKDKVCVLLKYIKGKEYTNNTLDIKTLKKVATLHAEITKKLNIKREFDTFEIFCTNEKINKNKAYMLDKINQSTTSKTEENIINDYKVKINIINSLDLDKIFDFLNKNIKTINCHGDYSVQQLIFDKEKIYVLDFASFRKLPISWEIIRSYSYGDESCKNGEIDIDNLIEYIESFTEIYKLSLEEIVCMPIIYLLQLLSSNYGYKQYFNSKLTDLLNFANFRTRLCENIFKNLQYLENALYNHFSR